MSRALSTATPSFSPTKTARYRDGGGHWEPRRKLYSLADPANVYKGLADANIGGNEYAYVANFRSGAIDVLKGNGGAPNLTGNFTDPGLPAGYAPFDIANIGGVLYVTYAVQDGAKHDDVAGPGNGIVDAFDLQGNFLRRLVTNGVLNSPWGLALAPAGIWRIRWRPAGWQFWRRRD